MAAEMEISPLNTDDCSPEFMQYRIDQGRLASLCTSCRNSNQACRLTGIIYNEVILCDDYDPLRQDEWAGGNI